MPRSANYSFLFESGTVLVLTVATFALDLLTPHGWAVWLLYFIPLILTLRLPNLWAPYYFVASAFALTIAGAALSQEGGEPAAGLLNRVLGVAVMGMFAWLMVSTTQLRGQATTAIAAQARAEAHLSETEARFERLVTEVRDYAIYMLDPDGTIVSWNEGAKRLKGYEADEVIGSHFSRLYRPEDQAAGHPAALLKKAAEEGRVSDEGWRVRKDGTQFFADVVITALHDTDGHLTGFAKVTRDMTERNRLVEQFRLAVEAAPSGMLLVDETGRIQLVNAQIEQMFGYSREELLGQSVELLVPIEARAMHADARRSFMNRPEPRKMGKSRELNGRRKDGAIFPIEIGLNPIRTKEGLHVLAAVVDITDRKRLQRDLEERELLLRTIIETEPECVKVLAPDGTVRSMNAAGLHMVEAERIEQVAGQDVCRLVAPEHREAFRHLTSQAAQGISGQLEFQAVGLKGGTRWLEAHAVPLRDPQGHISDVLAVTRDVTSRKQAEAALRESTERVQLMIRYAPVALALLDRDLCYLAVSRRWISDYRLGDENLIGRSHYEVFPEIPDYWKAVHQRGLAGEVIRGEEDRVVRKDGSEQWLRWEVRPWYAADESVGGLVFFTEDITERKRTQEALQTSAARLQSAIDAANVGTWMVDLKTETDTRDAGLNRMLGLDPVESSHPLDDFLSRILPEDQPACNKAWKEALQETHVYDMTHRIVRKDGAIRWVRDRGRIICDHDGEPLFAVGACVDLTDQVNLEQQLRRTERLAELGTLASGMAHEIGTPMNVILGRAEYLMDRVKEEPIKKGLQTIIAQVERITRVMNQLLSFARRRPPERGLVSLGDVVEASVDMFQERLASSRVQLDLRLDAHCPKLQADADQMSQVLINLIMNALHAMPNGGRLTIGLTPEQAQVKLTIGDTGHGIPQDALRKIFEPFFTTKEFGKGTGLGLTVVKGIIEEHQGTIAVESEEGKGTTFTVRLPICREG
jgi:PAS domain S-box-containing protein